jgi:hypothetical protein
MKNKKYWSTKYVMDQIYQDNLWGGGSKDFYSGNGSHDPNLVSPYLDNVIAFLESSKKKNFRYVIWVVVILILAENY